MAAKAKSNSKKVIKKVIKPKKYFIALGFSYYGDMEVTGVWYSAKEAYSDATEFLEISDPRVLEISGLVKTITKPEKVIINTTKVTI